MLDQVHDQNQLWLSCVTQKAKHCVPWCLQDFDKKTFFFEGIMEVLLPDNWKSPILEKYEVSTNQDEHVAIYITLVSLYTFNDVILCKVFPTILKGVVLSWLTWLPLYLIDSFDTLVMKFGAQFVISRPHHFTFITLVNIR